MSDVEARREARRRKILENSDKRLKKITSVEKRSSDYELEGYKSSVFNSNENVTNGDVHVHNGATGNIITPEITEDPSSSSRLLLEPSQDHLTKTHRLTIIIGIATVLNVLLICFSELNILLDKIFLPLLCFEAIDLLYNKNQTNTNEGVVSLIFLLFRNAIPRHLFILNRYFALVVIILKDVMVYFFAFVCVSFLLKVLCGVLFY
ncbi:uncharacterized protein LOC115888757 [Sitophilus oryzae]|uniref:Uncharacterized protein LOC115888757 n=1 Tax=Sitophilus oryzae TaxID=7048 RepID=A0A6J2YKB3_SITOR|nr:uncharacterized protein LOC115888757 [Sitophilus oryzae]XP_030764468.1 uncharacterized protein LOC115888757 [Sitophilus oryzae]XP_030764471.1 uncharacterized protein LOC115888757 [Sitophilus oryzae]